MFLAFFQYIIDLIEYVFGQIFGAWNWSAIVAWLPQDFYSTINSVMIVLFGWAIFKVFRSLVP